MPLTGESAHWLGLLALYGVLPYKFDWAWGTSDAGGNLDKRYSVTITRTAEKQLRRLPARIKEAALVWAESVEEEGLRAVRKLPGYHDEPLAGERKGQRSVRLTIAYRLFYEETDDGIVSIVRILEINKHEY